MKPESDQFWWGGNPAAEIKFTREKQGYKPEEVDTVLDELLQKNKELTSENARLRETLAQCEPKIRQLAQNTEALERELRKSAGADAKTLYKEMSRLIEVIRTAQDSSRQSYDQINSALRSAAEGLIALQSPAPPQGAGR